MRGFQQGDVLKTLGPVVDFDVIRTVLFVAVQRGLHVHQLNVKTSFLHGEIDEETFIKPPVGLSICEADEVLLLREGLYSSNQAPRLWIEKWHSIVLKLGFRPLLADQCVYIRQNLWLLIYVDDIVIISSSMSGIDSVRDDLSRAVDLQDMGEPHDFLGVEFIKVESGAILSQQHYVTEMVCFHAGLFQLQ